MNGHFAAVMTCLAFGVSLSAPLAEGAEPAHHLRVDDPLVHVQWSAAFGANKSELENYAFDIKAGFRAPFSLLVVNNGTSAITNVTLVVWFTDGVEDWSLEETFVGNPPGVVFADWPEVPPNDFRLAGLDFEASSTPGPFAGEFLVLFDRGETAHYSRTTVHGVVSASPSAEGIAPVGGPTLAGHLAAACIAVLIVQAAARRGK